MRVGKNERPPVCCASCRSEKSVSAYVRAEISMGDRRAMV